MGFAIDFNFMIYVRIADYLAVGELSPAVGSRISCMQIVIGFNLVCKRLCLD